MHLLHQRRLNVALFAALTVVGGAVAYASLDLNQGRTFVYQGYLENNGTPESSPHDFRFVLSSSNAQLACITDADISGCGDWRESHDDVDLQSGSFSAVMGSIERLDDDDLNASQLWMSIAVKAPASSTWSALGEPQEVHPVPSASRVAEMNDYTIETLSVTGAVDIGTNVDVGGNVEVTGNVRADEVDVRNRLTVSNGSTTRSLVELTHIENNGANVAIGSGQTTAVGGGESANNYLNQNTTYAIANEDLLLTTDNDIKFIVVNGNDGTNVNEQMVINRDQIEINDDVVVRGDDDGCQPGMERVGMWCIDNAYRQGTYSEAVSTCHAERKMLCPLQAIMTCDFLNTTSSTANSCRQATDATNGPARVRVDAYHIFGSGAGSPNAFNSTLEDHMVCYDPGAGTEAGNSLDGCPSDQSEPYFCCNLANPLLR